MKVAIVTAFPCGAGKPRGGVEAVSVSLVRALGALADLDMHVRRDRASWVNADCARALGGRRRYTAQQLRGL